MFAPSVMIREAMSSAELVNWIMKSKEHPLFPSAEKLYEDTDFNFTC